MALRHHKHHKHLSGSIAVTGDDGRITTNLSSDAIAGAPTFDFAALPINIPPLWDPADFDQDVLLGEIAAFLVTEFGEAIEKIEAKVDALLDGPF